MAAAQQQRADLRRAQETEREQIQAGHQARIRAVRAIKLRVREQSNEQRSVREQLSGRLAEQLAELGKACSHEAAEREARRESSRMMVAGMEQELRAALADERRLSKGQRHWLQ